MERNAVSSSNIKSIGYDEKSKVLEIEFHGGKVYQYSEVPKQEYMGLMSASSHGSYFHANIKDKYSYTKIG